MLKVYVGTSCQVRSLLQEYSVCTVYFADIDGYLL